MISDREAAQGQVPEDPRRISGDASPPRVKELRLRQGDLLECEVKDRRIILSPVQGALRCGARSLLDEISRKGERLGVRRQEIDAAVRSARKR